ncbi:NAD(P)-dependent oxidoreductase [Deinococcus planocerae]|uniref:NAD(P)-dependent oxidoreductase n=1 Tax=Deinococcus planocerae TaxID=1737569 RepID=UPI000C7EC54C|nr:NAD(P)H-binding protein [Deinococcus planocerae]
MRVLLLGATGHLGLPLLRQTLAAGHEVTAFVRRPEGLESHPRLRVVRGDVLDPAEVAAALPGHGAVLSTLGGSPDVLTRGARHIVAAMQAGGVRRLIAVAAAGILPLDDRTLVRDLPSFPASFGEVSAAHLQVHEELRASDLDWTLLCPPALVDAAPTGRYRVQAERALADARAVSTGDAAHFILGELAAPRFVRSRVAIAS